MSLCMLAKEESKLSSFKKTSLFLLPQTVSMSSCNIYDHESPMLYPHKPPP